ncbi:MAG: 3-deoxy-manno-octulosonate cytidylyltransferase [Robiginitomaculum sp.]|nr:MAG: 3-deoxy-manno-octulosonate cytidylyltransferase [Robiginitomaculum sp.]
MSVLIIIPARLASTRLPGKPLAKIAGIPMVVCVARAVQIAGYGAPVIAAADVEIVQVAKEYDIAAVLTDTDLPSGSDRVRAAAEIVDPKGCAEIILNVQGDMPELLPEHLGAVIDALKNDPQADIATCAFQSHSKVERRDENVVKVVLGEAMPGKPVQAIGFTRTLAGNEHAAFWHHIGIYAYRRAALERFCALPPSSNEKRANLEQLRALDDGMKIVCALVENDCPGIDSPEDLARIRGLREGTAE